MLLPQYQCHKVVQAAPITRIIPHEDGEITTFVLDVDGRVVLHDIVNLSARIDVQIGWYFVIYDDGYVSYSPPKAFEEGYRRVPDAAE